MKKMFLSLSILIAIFSTHTYGFVFANDIVDAFPSPIQKELSGYIVSGASQFLLSESQAMLLLNEYEISDNGFNIQASLDYAKKALTLIETSITGFQNAKTLGLKTGVDGQKAIVLKTVSYDTIIAGMNSVVADKLLKYFKSGDVIGIYSENLDNISKIQETLTYIISILEQGKKPGLETYWKLYQQYSDAALFGNYATVIGRTVFAE
jgi:hypothetical protein